jgi:hypothetical protein
MKLFRRRKTKLEDLLEKFLLNNGEEFAKIQMREQADNMHRIKVMERHEHRKEMYLYLKHKIEIGVLSDDEKREFDFLQWFIEKN